MTIYVVYDSEGGMDSDEGEVKESVNGIKMQVHKMMNIFKLYTVDVRFVTLSDWDANMGNGKNVVFITSIENEAFHTKVKQLFCRGLSNCLLVLQYSSLHENYVKRFKTSVKNSLKKKEPNKEVRKKLTAETLDRIEAVTDIRNVSQWWPKVLKFLIQTPVIKNGKPVREIGIFFKVDWDNETQVEWLSLQRNALENIFKVRCRDNDSPMTEETYIKHSTCVVMYVDRSVYQDARSKAAREEGKRKMLDSIKETRDTCSRHGTKFHVFVDQAGVRLTNVLVTDYSLKMVGNGMMFHWLGLLSMLNLIRVERMPDTVFYSKTNVHEQELEKFRPDLHPHLFRTVVSPREGIQRVASPSGVLADTLRQAGSLKSVCYQSRETAVDDSTIRPSLSCCTRLMALRDIL